MAFLECAPHFQALHRTPDLPVYEAGFKEFKQLALNGRIEGDWCRIHIGDRAPIDADVFVTVWRNVRVSTPAGWTAGIDVGEGQLRYRYDRSFNPAITPPTEVVAAAREILLAPIDSN